MPDPGGLRQLTRAAQARRSPLFLANSLAFADEGCMADLVHEEAMLLARDENVRQILEEVCRLTGMGFAAVARVTEDRWIACQVIDQIQFGMNPGDELGVATTICDDIRKTSQLVVINDATEETEWRSHPTPTLYGFKSYISVPIILSDASFFGTLCAIDPERRDLRGSRIVPIMENFSSRIAQIIERHLAVLAHTL